MEKQILIALIYEPKTYSYESKKEQKSRFEKQKRIVF